MLTGLRSKLRAQPIRFAAVLRRGAFFGTGNYVVAAEPAGGQ